MLAVEERYVTVPEVAEMLKMSRATIYKWIRQGYLPAYRLGHEMRIKESDLQEFMEERRTDRKND
jgi:putative molybdopterin biosynthesis protein